MRVFQQGSFGDGRYDPIGWGCGSTNSRHAARQASLLARAIPSVCKCLISRVGSNGRCNTIWYKAVFKGGVYETRETVWAFSGAETRRVASLEVGADVA